MNYKNSSYKYPKNKRCHKGRLTTPVDERYQYVHYCYTSEAVRNIDYLMVERGFVDTSYELMIRAAEALLTFINRNYATAEHISIVCGAGNNAGDGYALARLAKIQDKEPHLNVQVISIIEPEHLSGDAHTAYLDWLACGGTISSITEHHFSATDLIVDALLGTGLNRTLEGEWYDAVAAMNKSTKPVLAVDIPSGLNANTGASLGIATNATHTITFIAQKIGMYTAKARYYCGDIHFASLGVADDLYQEVYYSAVLLEWADIARKLPCRSPISHKGDHGHLLIIGGDYGMAGACRIAGEAALRSGTGLVSIATRAENVNAITGSRPELMVHGVETADDLEPLLAKATAIAIGPGLGTEQWGFILLDRVIQLIKQQYNSKNRKISCVFDADALNIMSQHNLVLQSPDVIYTPHFGEASRLLKHKSEQPADDTDRFAMIQQLKQRYYGTFVLKGAGTLINSGDDILICPYGNEGMASAGMGDCLTGIIGALLAQKLSLPDAVQLGVCLHAKAGDLVAQEGKNGMLVSDLFPKIRHLMNYQD